MTIHRVVCPQCGLAVTHVTAGDRAVTSFLMEEGRARCQQLSQDEDAVMNDVERCERLRKAIVVAMDEGRAAKGARL